MKNLFASIFVPLLLWSQQTVAAVPLERLEITGVLQQWRAAASTIVVTGKTYQMADDVQFIDGAAKPVDRSTLRSGARIMLLVADGKATHVVVNPAETSPFDQPKK